MSASHEPQPRVWEALEACRPAADDLSDPGLEEAAAALRRDAALEEQFSRMQKLDAVLCGAIQDVPLPAGLHARLAARLQEQAAGAKPGTRRIRRALLGMGLTALAATLLVCMHALWSGRGGSYHLSEALEAAITFYASDPAEGAVALPVNAPPWAYPISPALRASLEVRWRRVQHFLGTGGVAYDLVSRQGHKATLYVVRQTVEGAPSEPAKEPAHDTGNCVAAAWQANGLLYVLVVPGNARTYGEFLDLPTGPIT